MVMVKYDRNAMLPQDSKFKDMSSLALDSKLKTLSQCENVMQEHRTFLQQCQQELALCKIEFTHCDTKEKQLTRQWQHAQTQWTQERHSLLQQIEQLQNSQADLSVKNETISRLQQQLQALNLQLTNDVQGMQNMFRTLLDQYNALKKDMQLKNKQVTDLQTNFNATQQQLQGCASLSKACEDKVVRADTLVDDVHNQILALQNEVTLVSTQLKQALAERNQLLLRQQELESMAKQAATLTQEEQATFQNQLHRVQQDMTERLAEATALTEALQQEYRALQRDLADTRAKETALQQQVQELLSQRQAQFDLAGELQTTLVDLQEQMRLRLDEFRILSAAHASCQGTLGSLQEQLTRHDSEHKACQAKVDALQKELESLRQEKAKAIETAEGLQQAIEAQREQIAPVLKVAQDVCDDLKRTLMDNEKMMLRNWNRLQTIQQRLDRAPPELAQRWNAFYNGPAVRDFQQGIQKLFSGVPTESALSSGSVLVKDTMTCAELRDLAPEAMRVSSMLNEYDNFMTNAFEDLAGAVRVYVKMKPMDKGVPSIVAKQGKMVTVDTMLCGGGDMERSKEERRFGPFFGVMPEEFSNMDVYRGCQNGSSVSCCREEDPSVEEDTRGLCRALQQIQDGYHSIVFGYGASGSGKTYTLFGDANAKEKGVVQIAMEQLGAPRVRLVSIYELCAADVSLTTNNISTKVIYLHGSDSDYTRFTSFRPLDLRSQFYQVLRDNGVALPVNDAIQPRDLHGLFTNLEHFRKTRALYPSIKATPNNPVSSRSHLFMTLEFKFSAEQIGYLTVVDMGGVESPFEIFDLFYQPNAAASGFPSARSRTDDIISIMTVPNTNVISKYVKQVFTPDNPLLSWYVKPVSFANALNGYELRDVVTIMKEGIFINETVHQMVFFFIQRLRGIQEANKAIGKSKTGKYSPTEFLVGQPGAKDSAADRVGMYKLLNMLSSYKRKSAKFIMLFMIRGEATYCRSTVATLSVAERIQ